MAINRYILSLEADFDLEEVFDFTYFKFGLNQAIKYLTEIEEVFEKLVRNPEIGRTRNEIKKNLLSIPVGEHVVFYRISSDYIVIVRVLYGGRDLPKSF